MGKKSYATLMCAIYGTDALYREDGTFRDKEIDSNEDLIDEVDEIMEETFGIGSLEYCSLRDFLMERKNVDAFAQYLRDNADEIANRFTAKALRKMRHPRVCKRLAKYLKED